MEARMTTEPTGRLQPEVSFRKVEVSSLSVPSSIRMMARQSPLPLLGRAAGKHWSDKMKAQGLLLPTCPSRMLWGLTKPKISCRLDNLVRLSLQRIIVAKKYCSNISLVLNICLIYYKYMQYFLYSGRRKYILRRKYIPRVIFFTF